MWVFISGTNPTPQWQSSRYSNFSLRIKFPSTLKRSYYPVPAQCHALLQAHADPTFPAVACDRSPKADTRARHFLTASLTRRLKHSSCFSLRLEEIFLPSTLDPPRRVSAKSRPEHRARSFEGWLKKPPLFITYEEGISQPPQSNVFGFFCVRREGLQDCRMLQ